MDVRVQVYGLLDSGRWLCLFVTRTAMSLLPETRRDVGNIMNRKPPTPRGLDRDEE